MTTPGQPTGPDSARATPSMPIGAFSRACLISVKALRAYHADGLLVPSAVDPLTGYRAYDPGQLADALVIRRLRDLDVPLADIARIVAARDPELTADLLGAHQRRLQDRLADAERLVAAALDAGRAPEAHTPARIRTLPHEHALAVRQDVGPADFAAFFGAAFARLYALAERLGAPVVGPPSGVHPTEYLDGPAPITAAVPVQGPVSVPAGSGAQVIELPGVSVATLTHRGPYDEIGGAYALLGAWAARHADIAPGPVRERYLVGPGEADPPDYLTEICWPVADRAVRVGAERITEAPIQEEP